TSRGARHTPAARDRARRNCRTRDRAACRPCRRATCRCAPSRKPMSPWRHYDTRPIVNEPIATDELLDALCGIARHAGSAIMDVYGNESVAVELKNDRSPLTAADRAAHGIIRDALAALVPPSPLLSEESPADEVTARRGWPRYWLVDPLDGTKEFLKRNGEFTVNIALVDGHRAVLGVVFAPALDLLYFGAEG